MSPTLREQLRYNLLLQADAASSLGLTETAYLWGARVQGYRVEPDGIAAELQYLTDKGFLAPASKAISPELARHRITGNGRDFLAGGDIPPARSA